jgi:hypothetical protein
MHPIDIFHFCFTKLTNKQQFVKDSALDVLIAQRFGSVLDEGF